MCNPNHKGIQSLGFFLVNMTFFPKWRWSLILDTYGLLCDILSSRYGTQVVSRLQEVGMSDLSQLLSQKKGISLMILKSKYDSNWFVSSLSQKVGLGFKLPFRRICGFGPSLWILSTLGSLVFLTCKIGPQVKLGVGEWYFDLKFEVENILFVY